MIRALFVGDLTSDPTRRERAESLMSQTALYGIEPLDSTLKLLCRVTDTPASPGAAAGAWRLGETAHRITPWRHAAPKLIVGFDVLHTAIACHAFPGIPWIVHVSGLGTGLPQLALNAVTMLPGLHEVISGVLRGAAQVLVANPRNQSMLAQQWGVPADRLLECPLDIGRAGPCYVDAVRGAPREHPARFSWWLDLWGTRAPHATRTA